MTIHKGKAVSFELTEESFQKLKEAAEKVEIRPSVYAKFLLMKALNG